MFVAPCTHNTLPSQESPAKDKATTIQEKAACMRRGEASQSQRTGSQPSYISSLPIRVVFNERPFTSLHTPTYVCTWVFKWCNSVKHNVICGCTRIRTYVHASTDASRAHSDLISWRYVPVLKPVFALRGASFLAQFLCICGSQPRA